MAQTTTAALFPAERRTETDDLDVRIKCECSLPPPEVKRESDEEGEATALRAIVFYQTGEFGEKQRKMEGKGFGEENERERIFFFRERRWGVRIGMWIIMGRVGVCGPLDWWHVDG